MSPGTGNSRPHPRQTFSNPSAANPNKAVSSLVAEKGSDAMSSSAVPSSAMPSSAMPSSVMPSSVMSSSAVTSNAMTSNAMPSNAMKSNGANIHLPNDAMNIHFPTAQSLVPVDSQTFYCKDSRGDDLNFGAPGGDFGEFLLAMDVAFKSASDSGRWTGSLAEIGKVLDEWVDEKCSPSRPFYMHSDTAAWTRLCSAAELTGFAHPLEIKDAARRCSLLRAVGSKDPSLHGCGHLRLIKEQPEAYKISLPLMDTLLAAFFQRLWRLDDLKTDNDVLFKIYPGALEARGLVVIYGPDSLTKSLQGLQNPPASTSQQLFILNQHATRVYRRDHLTPFLAQRLGLEPLQLFAEIERKGWANGGRSADALAAGKPLYRVDLMPEDSRDKPVG